MLPNGTMKKVVGWFSGSATKICGRGRGDLGAEQEVQRRLRRERRDVFRRRDKSCGAGRGSGGSLPGSSAVALRGRRARGLLVPAAGGLNFFSFSFLFTGWLH